MELKNKILLPISLFINLVFLILFYYNNNFSQAFVNNSVNNKQSINNEIAVMVNEGNGNYIKNDTIPVGNYVLNEEKSYCVGYGIIKNYDSTFGTIQYSFDVVDECYVYFDLFALSLANHNLAWNNYPNATSYKVYAGDTYTEVYTYIKSMEERQK